MKDAMGDRMKMYESANSRRAIPLLPVVARIDGKCFSSYTRGMGRPYDERMSRTMNIVTQILAKETNALVGYTQSDEISLVWYSDDPKSQIFMDGKIMKMVSILASLATATFNKEVHQIFQSWLPNALFDARVWELPTLEEAANVFLWREQDAVRSSVQMAAQSVYSHKELHCKNNKEMHEMLHQKDINWNDYPAYFKRGQWTQKRKVERPFTADEIENLPPLHAARKIPDLIIRRTEYQHIADMPPFSKVENKIGFLFLGEDPVSSWEE